MGLSDKKEQQLRKMPMIESRLSKSKDGKYLIHRTVITHIRPVAYYEAVLTDKERLDVEDMPLVSEA